MFPNRSLPKAYRKSPVINVTITTAEMTARPFSSIDVFGMLAITPAVRGPANISEAKEAEAITVKTATNKPCA
jgi:hypothetical protein